MGLKDHCLPEMDIGLGIIAHDMQHFYPKAEIEKGIEDRWLGHRLHIGINPGGGIPDAEFPNGRRPLQLFTRWYEFSYTFPACQIYGHDTTPGRWKAIQRPHRSR